MRPEDRPGARLVEAGILLAVARCGIDSCRARELNGRVARDPETPVSGKRDQIAVDGKVAEASGENLSHDEQASRRGDDGVRRKRPGNRIRSIEPEIRRKKDSPPTNPPWVAPVGRLDKASEGLLLLTNDSEWGARITAPETHLDKTYHVQLGTVADEEFIQALVQGVKTKDGEVLRAKLARRLRSGQKNCWLEIVLDEGKNRQIRRMMEAMGVEVLRLVRVAIGPLQLGDLARVNTVRLPPAKSGCSIALVDHACEIAHERSDLPCGSFDGRANSQKENLSDRTR